MEGFTTTLKSSAEEKGTKMATVNTNANEETLVGALIDD
jgi:hypothetical protein